MITRNGLDAGDNPINGTPRQPNSAITPTATPIPTTTFAPTDTYTPTITFTPTDTLISTDTPTLTGTPTATGSATPTPTTTSTVTPTFTTTSTSTPTTVPALVLLINEVAWAGTQADSNDEWIELYNPGAQAINLAGWKLVALDGSPEIILSGQVAAGGYYLLERTDDNTVSDVPASLIYSGALSNDGEVLKLLAPNGSVVDTANLDGGSWPAGSSSPNYASMERRGVLPDSATSWITNTSVVANGHDADGNAIKGTPGQPNWAYSVTPTVTTTSTDTLISTDTLTLTGTPTATGSATPTPTTTSTVTPTFTTTSTSTPTTVPALALLINEVAWGGTQADSNDEWIELYNPGAQAINLAGWKLVALDGSPEIILGGQVAAGGYYLLERTNDNTVSDVPASLIYGGALSNDGEVLKLLAPNESVVDTANLDGGAWPAGSGSPNYASMERRGVLADSATSWITNTGVVANGHDADRNAIKGTPGQPNWAYSVTPTLTTMFTPTPTRTQTPTRTPTRTPTMQPIVLVINEFLPHPHTDWNGDGVANVYDEYIEIMNVSTEPVSLKNWKLDNGMSGTNTYALPDVTLEPRAITRFFRSDSGLPFSDGGAAVRLLRPGGQTADIYTYPLVEATDITWCRLPDGNGAWTFACRPTPGRPNARAESGYLTPTPSSATGGQYAPENCLLADTLPEGILQAECGDWRAAIWNWGLWGEDEEFWLESRFKWGVFIR